MKRGFIVVILMLTCHQALLARLLPTPFASSEEPSQLICSDDVGFAGSTAVAAGSCMVTRNCDYPPPAQVSCTSLLGNCQIGWDWVECDGQRQTCAPPPPPCLGLEPKCEDIEGSYCKYSNQTASCYFGFPGEDCHLTSCRCENHSMSCIYW
jgi:hypothetical protein